MKRSFTAVFAALLALLPLAAAAQALEHEVKAAYLFRFLSFIEWPEQAFARPDTPISVGVLAADDVFGQLEEIVPGRVVQGRPVTVRRLRDGESLAGLHVLYVGRAAAGQLPRAAQQRGMLVVSDAEAALDQGAVIAFVSRDGRVRFHVALDAAERRGLRISSRMLGVAEYVRQGKL